jgi:hypothetical protein
MGDITAADRLDDLILPSQIFDQEENIKSKIEDLEKQLKRYEERYSLYSRIAHKTNKSPSVAIKAMQRLVIETFQKLVIGIKKCENCNANALSYRKDGYCKIFQRRSSKRMGATAGIRSSRIKVR